SDDGHEYVEPAERRGGARDEPVQIRPRPDITDKRDRAGAGRCQFIDGLTCPVRMDVRDGDSRASRRESPRDRAPDAVAPDSDYQGAHAVQRVRKVVHGWTFPYDQRRAGVG